MGYFNIIDSLNDKRVDEGMVSSISKNTKKQNKDTKRMVDAVLSGQISKLSNKDTCIEYSVSLERTTLEFTFRFNSKVESSTLGNYVVSFIHTNDFCKIVQFNGYVLIKFFL